MITHSIILLLSSKLIFAKVLPTTITMSIIMTTKFCFLEWMVYYFKHNYCYKHAKLFGNVPGNAVEAYS